MINGGVIRFFDELSKTNEEPKVLELMMLMSLLDVDENPKKLVNKLKVHHERYKCFQKSFLIKNPQHRLHLTCHTIEDADKLLSLLTLMTPKDFSLLIEKPRDAWNDLTQIFTTKADEMIGLFLMEKQ